MVLLKAISLVAPLRVAARDESRGLDVPIHGEQACSTGEGAILIVQSEATPAEPEPHPEHLPAPQPRVAEAKESAA